MKFKEEEGKTGKLTDTIDAVVMGYYKGEGETIGIWNWCVFSRRPHFASLPAGKAGLRGASYNDEIVTLTKIGTGVTDQNWGMFKKTFYVKRNKKETEGIR